MKKIALIILVLVFVFTSNISAQTRDELYRAWGPQLLEAIVLVIADEINLLRQQHGLAERTPAQIRNAIATKLGESTAYDWMN